MAIYTKGTVKGLSSLTNKLRAMAAKCPDPDVSVLVGYTAEYAVYVHEMEPKTLPDKAAVEAYHAQKEAAKALKKAGQKPPKVPPPQGAVERDSGIGFYWGPPFYGPKFLEGPARQFANDISFVVTSDMLEGKTFAQSLIDGGLFLQRMSQERVPVEYGNLRASAFTRLEKGQG